MRKHGTKKYKNYKYLFLNNNLSEKLEWYQEIRVIYIDENLIETYLYINSQ